MIEREIRVNANGVSLAGTLCLPSETGRFPSVLMIHGSGPLDRNENARGAKINVFNTVAHYLAGRGVASLRYDKRGCGESSGSYDKSGLYDLLEDAKAAYRYLAEHESVDSEAVFLLGHSEGTLIAPKVAVEYPEVTGLILLGAVAHNMECALRYQAQRIKEDIERGKGLTRLIVRITWRLVGDPLEIQPALFQRVMATNKDSFRFKLQKINAKWLREHLADDPVAAMSRVTCPILAITGEKDVQVDPQDVVLIAQVAQGEVEYHIVPDLTHILRRDDGPPSVLNYRRLLKRDMDRSVLDLIGEWLERVLRPL